VALLSPLANAREPRPDPCAGEPSVELVDRLIEHGNLPDLLREDHQTLVSVIPNLPAAAYRGRAISGRCRRREALLRSWTARQSTVTGSARLSPPARRSYPERRSAIVVTHERVCADAARSLQFARTSSRARGSQRARCTAPTSRPATPATPEAQGAIGTKNRRSSTWYLSTPSPPRLMCWGRGPDKSARRSSLWHVRRFSRKQSERADSSTGYASAARRTSWVVGLFRMWSRFQFPDTALSTTWMASLKSVKESASLQRR
jgi:hypothetical protein